MKNFKERQRQLTEEKLEQTIDRIFPPELRAHYSQLPLLELLLRPGRKKLREKDND